MDSQAPERLAEFTARRRRTFYPKTDLPVADTVFQTLRNQSDGELGLTAEVLRAAAAAGQTVAPTIRRFERQGTFHRLYLLEYADGARRVMRFDVTRDYWGGLALHLEQWAGGAARAVGVPAPGVLVTDTSHGICPFDFQIMDLVGGRSLVEFDENEPEMQRLLAKYGALLARLHGVPARQFGWFDVGPLMSKPATEPCGLFAAWQDYLGLQLEAHLDACCQIGAVGPEKANRIREHFASLMPQLSGFQPALLHGDPGTHNAMTDGREITALLDWEDCLAGDPVYELAFWATFHPERRHAGFLKAYRTVRPLPDDFEVRFLLYLLRVALAKTVHRHRFGYVDRPGRPPAAQRIQNALDHLEAALATHS